MVVIKSYPVNVKNNTLKIQLYWAGKGTTDASFLGYGPIISVISVEPNFKPPNFGKKEDIIYPIVVGALFVISVLLILWIRCCNFQKTTNTELRGVDLQAGIFTLKKIERATKNFDPSNKIGEGGFGVVFKGLLSDETLIAVKQLSPTSKQGHREFLNEITLLSALRHPNLVRLYGCCTEGEQSSLILEYMENGCLSRALSDTSTKSKLTWRRRFNICLGIAKGLVYLHEESNNQVVHRDIKCSNVLLDANFNAKISDFGLSKLIDDENTQVNTRVVGTAGYMAPEIYISSNTTLTPKMDVYSFGIVALNLVMGITCSKFIPTGEYPSLRHKARHYQKSQRLVELVDSNLGSSYSSKEVMAVVNVAILCSEDSPSDRPAMSLVLGMLCGKVDIPGKVDKLETNGSMDQRPKDWRDNSVTRENLSATDSYTESFVTEAVVTELS